MKNINTNKGRGINGLMEIEMAVLLFSSCEDVIDVPVRKGNLNLTCVEAGISTQEEPTVFLYKSLRPDQAEDYPGISGATVIISDDATPSNTVTLEEDVNVKGTYHVPQNVSYLGVAGREYTLTIQTDDETITAKDKLNAVEPIDSIQVVPSLRGDKRFLGIFTYGKEPKGVGDFYKWDIYINDILQAMTENIAFVSVELVNGNYIMKLEIFTDFYEISKPENRMLNLGDTIQVKQTSISEFAYNFYFQMVNQANTGFLFSVPPANIKSNFTSSNNKPVLGLFVARDISASNKVVIDQKIEDQLDIRP